MKILELKLQAVGLKALYDFYSLALELPTAPVHDQELVIRAGETRLVFHQAPDGWQGVYHFAFNIPANQFALAKAWIMERTALLKSVDGRDTFHSEGWSSDGLYFYDPAGNILELIARHTLDNARTGTFMSQNILSVSEIGLAVENVPEFVERLSEKLGTQVYDGAGSDTFTAVGDEQGLLIVVRQGRKWYPNLVASAEFLPMQVKVAANGQEFMISGVPYHIS